MMVKSKNITRRGLVAAKYAVIFRMLAQGISLFATVFLVRALSEHDYGIYNLFYSVISLLGMVFSFGLANTLQRYMPEYYNRGEYRIAHYLYLTASLIRLLSNVLVLALVLLFWDSLAPVLKITAYKNYFSLFTLIILLHNQRGLLETCLSSYLLQKYSHGISVLFILIKGIGYGTAILLQLNLWFVILVDLLAYVLIFGLLQIVYWKKIPKSGGKLARFAGKERRRIFRYALFYNFNDAGVGLLDVNIDNFFLAMYLDPVAVGAYAFCQRLTRTISRIMPINYLQDVIRPLFFSTVETSGSDKTKRNFQLLVKGVFLFQIPVFCFLLLFSSELINILFGGKFVEYYPVLIVVYSLAMLNAFGLPVGLVAQLRERANIILYSKVFALYNLVADIVFVKFWGIWGAVLATGSATLGKNFFIWFFVRQEASLSGMGPFFVRISCYWLFVCFVAWLLSRCLSSELHLLSIGILLFIAAFILQFRFIHLLETERTLLRRLAAESRKVDFFIRWSGIQCGS